MNEKMKVVIGCDHAGFDIKDDVVAYLRDEGYDVTDVGTFSSESCDYPDIAHILCKKIQKGDCKLGILICGTGIGMSIAANKHKGIRAACCYSDYCAEITRRHNDSNVICVGARVCDLQAIKRQIDIFLATGFDGGRHQTRVNKITEIENSEN